MQLDSYLKDYASFHQTVGNKYCHFIGIPMIVLSLLGLLDRVVIVPEALGGHASAAFLLWSIGSMFYVYLHVTLGISMMVSTAILYFLGTLIPVPVLWVLFVLGWVVQFVGHFRYEHKSPAFLKNLIHLMIGPVFIQNYFLKIHSFSEEHDKKTH